MSGKINNELVSVEIFKIDYDILNKIATEEGISIAHALCMQFSGFGFYDKGKIGWQILKDAKNKLKDAG